MDEHPSRRKKNDPRLFSSTIQRYEIVHTRFYGDSSFFPELVMSVTIEISFQHSTVTWSMSIRIVIRRLPLPIDTRSKADSER